MSVSAGHRRDLLKLIIVLSVIAFGLLAIMFNVCATTIFSDNCDSAESDELLTARTPDVGASWSFEGTSTDFIRCELTDGSGCTLGGSDCITPSGGHSSSYRIDVANATYPSADYKVSVTGSNIDNSDDSQHLIARYQDVNNFYGAEFSDTSANGCYIYKKVSGEVTDIAGAADCAVVDGSVVRFEVQGIYLRLYDDSELIVSGEDSDISDAGKAGIGFGAIRDPLDDVDNQELDDFLVESFVSGAPEKHLVAK